MRWGAQKIMDLEAANQMFGKRWPVAKLAAFICFAVTCVLLIGSLNAQPNLAAASVLASGMTTK
jgi:hypothetical protein